MKQDEKTTIRSGFTMIEVVITIAVIAILAAVLVPIIAQNIDAARHARAGSDVSVLGKSIIQFRRDTSIWPVSGPTGTAQLLFSDIDGGNDGTPDTSAIAAGPAGFSQWSAIPAANRVSLYYNLIDNGAGMIRGPSATGTPTWNGPYLSDAKPDPWGNAYLVNAQWLGGTGNVYVLSPGPGRPGNIETPFNGIPPANADDITFRLQ